MVAGSDSHHYHQLGSVYSDLPEGFGSLAELRGALRRPDHTLHIHPALRQKVRDARLAKQVIKRQRLG